MEGPYWRVPYQLEIELPRIGGLQVTRFMVTELIAAVLVMLVLIPVARHIARGHVSRGWFMNLFESLLLFIRDQVGAAGDRRARGGPLPALSVDGLLLRLVQ